MSTLAESHRQRGEALSWARWLNAGAVGSAVASLSFNEWSATVQVTSTAEASVVATRVGVHVNGPKITYTDDYVHHVYEQQMGDIRVRVVGLDHRYGAV